MSKRPRQQGSENDPLLFKADLVEEAPSPMREVPESIQALLKPLASLRITVALLAMAIFLVFAGTLAQTDAGIWSLVHGHFRTWIAWIDFDVFCQRIFFTDGVEIPKTIELPVLGTVRNSFPFPGGWTIGALMAINLFAAHTMRFKIQAQGVRLLSGLFVIVVGVCMSYLIVATASDRVDTPISTLGNNVILSHVIKGLLGALTFGSLWAVFSLDRKRKVEWWTCVASSLIFASLLALVLYQNHPTILPPEAMRILWQLFEGGIASLVLLGGCYLAFGKRAGIVLLHAGVALVMFNELVVHGWHVEKMMHIREGSTANYSVDQRYAELAIVDRSHPDHDQVVSIPESRLRHSEDISEDLFPEGADLPFTVRVVEYMPNSALGPLNAEGEEGETKEQSNPATRGLGLQIIAKSVPVVSGTDTKSGIDADSAYIEVLDSQTSKPLGTYLVSIWLDRPQSIEIGDKTYEMSLRFRRYYHPFSLTLDNFTFSRYLGTNTPRDFSSEIRLEDPENHVDRQVTIRMNQPLRYAGETFYQADWDKEDELGTVLQVVSNAGWMIPYMACMVVATGMTFHFLSLLLTFLKRRESRETVARPRATAAEVWIPIMIILVVNGWLFSKSWSSSPPATEFNFQEFGKLPVAFQGRIKPYDTLARNSLHLVSGRQTFLDEDDKEQPATRWLLDLITKSPESAKHRVLRIDNLELLDALDLERRKGYRYSLGDLDQERFKTLGEQVLLARDVEPNDRSLFQRRVMQLDGNLQFLATLVDAHHPPEFHSGVSENEIMLEMRRAQHLMQSDVPRPIPLTFAEKDWQPYASAMLLNMVNKAQQGKSHEATQFFSEILDAYDQGEKETFNRAVHEYSDSLRVSSPSLYSQSKTRFEVLFNQMSPFYYLAAVYVLAFVLTFASWIGWSRVLYRSAFGILVFAFIFHTLAIIARIYISGQPPVTTLYTSAVFIGWGCVGLSLILEGIFKKNVGAIVACVAGFSTLVIAHFLSLGGDTFTTLQAVLDTKFWLTTHVLCITFGYATTFLAGLFGIVYVVKGVLTPSLQGEERKDLTRMIYGTLCFATFFSFVGTVLGGLWADDSWGRFWGWDPKENGALIIVLWNALVLHARWGGIAKQRGVALLAIVGNIVTAWSWFGVNELGVGLHSYGFTDGTRTWLMAFVVSQLALIALGSLPTKLWASYRRAEPGAAGG